MRRVAVVALLCLLPVLTTDASDLIVRSGRLQAEVQLDPWKVSFVDRDAGPVLTESGAAPSGFRVESGWLRATRAIESRKKRGALIAVLETNDPNGRMLEATISPGSSGVISVELRLSHGLGVREIGLRYRMLLAGLGIQRRGYLFQRLPPACQQRD